MTDVQSQIIERLQAIEREEHIRILYACESGSRAWGVPAEDSDYDVKFIYIRPVNWYLSIFEKRDVIERPISDKLDIAGWDLKKALSLFRKSNPSLLEWLQSPIVYAEHSSAAEQIRTMSPLLFSPRSCFNHYLQMAKRNYRDHLQDNQVKIKKYFYVLRPILACEWIETYKTMPPIEFDRLTGALVPEGSVVWKAIQALVVRKKAGEAMDNEPATNPLHPFFKEKIAYFDRVAPAIPVSIDERDDQLDSLFRSTLKEVWEANDTVKKVE